MLCELLMLWYKSLEHLFSKYIHLQTQCERTRVKGRVTISEEGLLVMVNTVDVCAS